MRRLSRPSLKTMSVDESKVFLAFIRRTLTWSAEKRVSAFELLTNPWIANVKYDIPEFIVVASFYNICIAVPRFLT